MGRFEEYLLLNEATAKTDLYETAACLGIVANNSVISNIDKILAKDDNVDVLNLGNDLKSLLFNPEYNWNTSGAGEVANILREPDTYYREFALVCGLVKGMNNFIKKYGFGKNYFIHKDITKYYDIEKEVLGEIRGSKANTADCIVCNVPAETLLSSMKTEPIEALKDKIKVGNSIEYYQISLKKSFKEAQLGKIGSFLRNYFDYGVTATDALKHLKPEEEQSMNDSIYYKNLNMKLVNEGFIDKIKNISVSIWTSVKNTITKITHIFTSKYMKMFNGNIPKKHMDRLVKDLGIKESILEKGSFKKISSNNKIMVEYIIENPQQLINKINNSLKELESISSSNSDFISYDVKYLSTDKLDKKDPIQEAYALIANYSTLITLKDMITDGKDINVKVKRLIAEMLFGGTKLPLWKVYGDFGDSHSYEFLGTIETYISGNINDIIVSVLGWRFSPHSTHYATKLLMLESFDEKEKTYINFRMGTNTSSNISFNVEGTQYVKMKFNDDILRILKKK